MTAKYGFLVDFPLSGLRMSKETFETEAKAQEYIDRAEIGDYAKVVKLSAKYQPRAGPCMTVFMASDKVGGPIKVLRGKKP